MKKGDNVQMKGQPNNGLHGQFGPISENAGNAVSFEQALQKTTPVNILKEK